MSRSALTLAGLLAFALLAGLCLGRAGEIQLRLRDQVAGRLAAAGLQGVELAVDGLDVTLAGRLPSAEQVNEAGRVAGGHPGVRRLASRLEVGRAAGVRLRSAAGTLTMAGKLPGAATRDRILAAAAALWGDGHDAARLELEPGAPEVQRPDALVSVLALLRDRPGMFDLAWGPPVDVEGEVASAEDKQAFLERLATLVAGWQVTERIRVVPRTVASDLAALLAERSVEFATDSARLTGPGEALLDEVAQLLAGSPDSRFAIDGHTDSSGGERHNYILSLRRAAAVRDYLAAAGLDARRFEIAGLGESRPLASNETAEGRRRNRRVDFRLLEEVTP